MECFQFGISRDGLPITAYRIGSGKNRILVLGGVHGNEPDGVVACYGLLQELPKHNLDLEITLVPQFNIDGVLANRRVNSHGIDLNRNLPTKDWTSEVAKPDYNPGPTPGSEPENQGLISWLETNKPKRVFSLHSWKPLLNVNGAIQPEAQCIQKLTGYEIHEDIGYPTPGCLGTFTGLEGDIPTLTYEIKRGLEPKEVLRIHVPALVAAFQKTQEILN